MNKHAILHIPDSKYCFALGDNTVALRLRTAKDDAPEEVNVLYGVKYDFHKGRQSAPMSLSFTDNLFNYYTVSLDLF